MEENNKMKIIARNIMFAAIATVVLLTAGVGYALAADQEIALSPSSSDQAVGTEFTLTVTYDVSDNDSTLNALGVRIHFDSTKLDYAGYSDFFESGSLSDPQLQNDTENKDSDDSTDKLILLGYSEPFSQNWPNQVLPLNLMKLLFTVKGSAATGSTSVNVTRVTGHAGYGFVGTGATATVAISR